MNSRNVLPLSSCISTILAGFLIGGCSLVGASERDVADSPFFPLGEGNLWVYQRQGSAEDRPADTARVVGIADIDGRRYVIVHGERFGSYAFDRSAVYLRSDDDGRILRYDDGSENVWLDVTLDDGSTYEYPYSFSPETRSTYTVTVKRPVQVETPAGTFENGIRFEFDDHQVTDEGHSYTLAPDVGIVTYWSM